MALPVLSGNVLSQGLLASQAIPPKPQDGNNGSSCTNLHLAVSGDGQKKGKVSFRDKLIGSKDPAPRRERIDLLSKNLFRIDFEEGDRLRPKCYLDENYIKDLRKPWKDAVTIKLLGKSLSFFTMRDRLKSLWKPGRDYELVDIGHGFYMVKFDLIVDRDKVINDGPWMFFDHYLVVRECALDFISSLVTIDSTLVWIRFPSLGMEYYDENVLFALASVVGKPIKIDTRTIDVARGKFERVCVEINLNQPVVGRFWFRENWFHVEYEGLHMLYKNCGIYGHLARNCPKKVVSSLAQLAEPLSKGVPEVVAKDQSPLDLLVQPQWGVLLSNAVSTPVFQEKGE